MRNSKRFRAGFSYLTTIALGGERRQRWKKIAANEGEEKKRREENRRRLAHNLHLSDAVAAQFFFSLAGCVYVCVGGGEEELEVTRTKNPPRFRTASYASRSPQDEDGKMMRARKGH